MFLVALQYLRKIAARCEARLRWGFGRTETASRRLLFIDNRLPLPWYGAGHSRAHAIVHALNNNGWKITCFSIEKNNVPTATIRKDIPFPIEVVKRGRTKKIRRFFFGTMTTLGRFLIGRVFAYDVVIVSRYALIKMMEEPLKWLKATNNNCKIVFDFEALPALSDRSRQALGEDRTRLDAEERIRKQIADVAWVDAVICNAAGDAQVLRQFGRQDALSVSYLADPTPTTRDFSSRKDFLFVGRLMEINSPNVDGLNWFVREVWPSIVQRLGPSIRLVVAGRVTAPSIRSIKSDSIQFLGVVPDLRDLYDQAKVVVAANRFSYGVPIKVLEAAANGVPTVTTDEVNFYLGWRNGVEILCSDAPLTFAQDCIRLYEDSDLWHKVRSEALNRIDPQTERKKFLDLVNGLAAQNQRPRKPFG